MTQDPISLTTPIMLITLLEAHVGTEYLLPSAARTATRKRLSNLFLIEMDPARGAYVLTNKGEIMVNDLLTLPIPQAKTVYVNYRGAEFAVRGAE